MIEQIDRYALSLSPYAPYTTHLARPESASDCDAKSTMWLNKHINAAHPAFQSCSDETVYDLDSARLEEAPFYIEVIRNCFEMTGLTHFSNRNVKMTSIKSLCSTSAIALLALAVSPMATAQEEESRLDTVTVSAQRLEESLQDVPLSVSQVLKLKRVCCR